MPTRVTIDPDLCIGSGDCARLVPAAYQIDEARGVAVPLPGSETEAPDRLTAAAMACPTQAITVIAADGAVLHRGNA